MDSERSFFMVIDKDFLTKQFTDIYGESNDRKIRTFFAPGSLVFCGEHNDYNGGMVLPCALSLGTYCAIRLRSDAYVHVYSSIFPEDGIQEFNVISQTPSEDISWVDYPKGAVWSLGAHGHHLDSGFDIYYHSNIPTDAGLGSSASFLVATLIAITKTMGLSNLTAQDLTLISKDAKNSFLDFTAGTLASFTSLMGKKDNALFFASNGMHYKYAPLELTLSKARIIIANSNKPYDAENLKEVLAKRKYECQEAFKYISNSVYIKSLCKMTSDQFETYKDLIPFDEIKKRARHLVYENERTYQAFNALNVKNLTRFGKVLNDSYVSLRDNFETSCSEVDTLVASALKCPGVIASRMTGEGLGGCTLNIVMADHIDEFIETVGREYTEKTGRKASFFIADVGDGAREIF